MADQQVQWCSVIILPRPPHRGDGFILKRVLPDPCPRTVTRKVQVIRLQNAPRDKASPLRCILIQEEGQEGQQLIPYEVQASHEQRLIRDGGAP